LKEAGWVDFIAGSDYRVKTKYQILTLTTTPKLALTPYNKTKTVITIFKEVLTVQPYLRMRERALAGYSAIIGNYPKLLNIAIR
jgi:hypothetical protein